MALGDERRAGGKAMEESRRAGGKAMEESRRAGGRAMEEQRRGASQLADDINRLLVPPSTPRSLRKLEERGGVSPKSTTATNTPKPLNAGGGIAGPLVETETPREYHPDVLVPTTDGLAWGRFPSVKKVFMADANAVEFSMEYRNDVPE